MRLFDRSGLPLDDRYSWAEYWGQGEHPIACFVRNWLYTLTPTWLADLQLKWLFDRRPGKPINKKAA